MPKPPPGNARASPAAAAARALIDEFTRLKRQFGATGAAARNKLILLARLREVPMIRASVLTAYHGLSLCLRAYLHNAPILAEAERQLRAFAARVAAHQAVAGGRLASTFTDIGIAGTPVSNAFTCRFVWTEHRCHEAAGLSLDVVALTAPQELHAVIAAERRARKPFPPTSRSD